MPEDITWDRIEPHTRVPALEEGLQARLADTLWMLARQWQVGEFRGEDAASPIHVRMRVSHTLIESFRNDASPGAAVERFPKGRPLESRVEAEASSRQARVALAGEVGLQLLRRLDGARLQRLRAPFRARFPLRLEPEDLRGLPAREVRRLRLLARGSMDGLSALGARPAEIAAIIQAADRAAVRAVLDATRAEHARRFDRPGESGETWVGNRLEHQFSIAAPGPDGEVTLSSTEYPGGHLDWYAFDAGGVQPHGLGPGGQPGRTLNVLPVPLAYAGMPAARYWEFEDGAVYYGGVEGGPADIGRLLVAEFALVYSGDWFLVPVRFPLGSLARVEGASVLNTFGEVHEVRSAAQWDEESQSGERPWAFFELSGDESAGREETPWLLLLPGVVSPQNGPPLERVNFVRDEGANLVWAIEERVETATGHSVRRRLEWEPEGEAPAPAEGEAWRYRLQSPVPPWWIPMVAERVKPDSPEVLLRRGRMLAWEELDDPRLAGARGRVLAPDRALRLHEEEIPNAGVQVTRHWQLARGADGRPHLWMARRRRPGRGERGSGLRYDSMIRQ